MSPNKKRLKKQQITNMEIVIMCRIDSGVCQYKDYEATKITENLKIMKQPRSLKT